MSDSNLLEAARAAVRAGSARVNDLYRPRYHFCPPCGWMNDPNGFICFRGQYHLFYQAHPYASNNGVMYWGHAVSRDLVTWEHLPVALAPDMPYDRDGCWSGGAVDTGEKLALIYTGNRAGDPRDQTQNLAFSADAIDFEKDAANPVITADSAPAGVDRRDLRDPFVWRQGEFYYCILGTLQYGVPTVLTYRSRDLRHWEYLGIFLQRTNSGYCYECPNFASLGEHDLLLLSPVDYPQDGLRFANRSSVVCSIGRFCPQTGAFTGGPFDEVDGGTDFYATQLTKTPDGRTVMIAWMNMWDRTWVTHELGHGWQGMCTFPREIWVENGRFMQRPVAELARYCTRTVTAEGEVCGERSFDTIAGRCLRLQIRADVSACRTFCLKLFSDGERYLLAEYDRGSGRFTLDRTRTEQRIRGHAREREGVRTVDLGSRDVLVLDILLDRCSAEFFFGEGERAMSMLVYNGERDAIAFGADGRASVRIRLSRPEECGNG